MERAVSQWLCQHPDLTDQQSNQAKKLQRSYVVYGCMVLLHSDAFLALDAEKSINSVDLNDLYELTAKHLKITHIAMTRPIPPQTSGSDTEENIVRSPLNFRTLYGDFGPSTCSDPATQADFDNALWVTAKQNSISQVWAPRWTMFSRGNISEKARLMTLPSVVDAVRQGDDDGVGCTAVDLYVGIGYFAFSYAKAGVCKVLGWDLNPWSCEGLRRGAKANKEKAVVMSGESDGMLKAAEDVETRFLVFNESNEHAAAKVELIRSGLPPIRHVNCGLLPTSKGSWRIAVQVLDANMAGWVHVHENFAVNEVEEKAEGVRAEFEQLLVGERGPGGTVGLEHVNRLKSYAPGVIHCVLDIYIPPIHAG